MARGLPAMRLGARAEPHRSGTLAARLDAEGRFTVTDPLALHIDSNFFSPYAMFVYVSLREKALPHTLHRVDLAAGAQRQPGYLARSLTGRVPMLEHGDFALTESTAIIEYLEDTFPAPHHAPVLPTERRQRARARQMLGWLNSDLVALRNERPTTVIFQAPSTAALTEAGRADADTLLQIVTASLSPDGAPLFGTWCIADTALAVMLNRLVANGDPTPAPVRAYVAREWQRPAVQAWLAKDYG
jgi:glutathione S-transferase